MKRIMFLCLLLIVGLCTKAQTSICGVPFGQPYDVAKSILYDKFGKADYQNHNEIWYDNKDYAGLYFGFIAFKFQAEGSRTYFNECFMGKEFSDVSLAKNFRNMICEKLQDKYDDLEIYKDSNGFLAAKGGENSINEREYGFFVYIVKNKSKYIVYLDYGPYNYANEEL
nr:MAG TPA: hypothetical protein [Bacteriophage sp.]